MEKNNIKQISDLSSMQRGILFHSLEEEDAYLIQVLLKMKGELSIDTIQNAFNCFVQEYDILRTGILYKNVSKPIKVVYKKRVEDAFYSKDMSLEEYLKNDRRRGFDLEKDLLIRMGIIEENREFNLIITFHHIILDGWSKDIILQRLFEIYSLLLNENYYPVHQKYTDITDDILKNEYSDFWKRYLDGYECSSTLLTLKESNEKNRFIKDVFKIDNSDSIKKVCLENSISINVFCLVVWGIEAQMLCNSDDIIFGNVISGRDVQINEISNVAGLFINTIPIRISNIKKKRFIEFAKEFARQYYLCMEKGHMPLNELVNSKDAKINLDHLVTFEEKSMTLESLNSMKISNLTFIQSEVIEHTQYPLTITFRNEADILIEGIYNENIVKREDIEMIFSIFQFLCNQIIENPDCIITELKCVNINQHTYWEEFNKNDVEVVETSIINEFEKVVQRNPFSIAIKDEKKQMTYLELNSKANFVAEELIRRGIKDMGVALYMKRSCLLMSTILGILKSDNYYIPIEYNYPNERVSTIIKEAHPAAIICDFDSYNKEISLPNNCEKICLSELIGDKKENVQNHSNSKSIAYIIYTSGTTGVPKGVVIENEGIMRIAKGKYLNVNSSDVILQLSNYAFDGSVFDIFAALLNGATLRVITEDDVTDLSRLGNCIKHEITVLFVTTALFNAIIENNIECLAQVRKILFGGERASVKHVRKAYEILGKNRLIHVYGPTETTIFASFYPINEIRGWNNVPIGYPVDGTHLYVLNTYGQLQPYGRKGELYISGIGLAREYKNDSFMTQNKFVYPLFEPNTRMYRTNDICVLSKKGELEFIDRNDNQIKLRGYRIELGDIQNALLELSYVQDAYVIPVKDNKEMLKICSYVVSNETCIDSNQVREDLRKTLPEFMIPSKNILIDKLPLNQNGKINKNELPEVEWEEKSQNCEEEFASEFEKTIVAIWSEVLNIKSLRHDSEFYDLGGDSIKAIKMVTQINKLGYNINIKDLFNNSTLKQLLLLLQQKGKQKRNGEQKQQDQQESKVDYMSLYME